MGLSQKDVLEQQNKTQLINFPHSEQESLSYHPESSLPGKLFARKKITLRQQRFNLANKSRIGFIYESKHAPNAAVGAISPVAKSFYVQTCQKKIQKMADYGILDLPALTSKVIGALGQYRLKVLEDAYVRGIISNKHEQKESLLRVTQNRIRLLQGLERLVNAYLDDSLDENVRRINDTFVQYIDNLRLLQNDIRSNLTVLNEFDVHANQKLIDQIEADIDKARDFQYEFQKRCRDNRISQEQLEGSLLASTGNDSIAQFIKLRMEIILQQAQYHNQNMTYSRKAKSLFLGRFDSICANALQVINDNPYDPHNPVEFEHQGYESTHPNMLVQIDFERLGKNRQAIRQHLMAIAQIQGKDAIRKNRDNTYTLISANQEHALKVTRFTATDVYAEKYYQLKRFAKGVVNFFSGTFFGFFDLTASLFLAAFGVEINSLATKLQFKTVPRCTANTKFDFLAKKIDLPEIGLGTKIGRWIGHFVGDTVVSIGQGLITTVKRARYQIGANLPIDWLNAHKTLPDEKDIYDSVEKELHELQGSENRLRDALSTDYINQYHFNLFVNLEAPTSAEKIKLYLTAYFQKNYKLTRDEINQASAIILSDDFLKSVRHYNQDQGLPFSAEEARRLAILLMLQRQQHLLPYLSYKNKRLLVELVRKQDRIYPYNVDSLNELLYPEPKLSRIATATAAILGYVPALLRCVLVFWDKNAWRSLLKKTTHDLNSIVTTVTTDLLKPLVGVVRKCVRGLFDILGNKIIARFEGLIRNDAHSFSKATSKIAEWTERSFQAFKEFVAHPFDLLIKFVSAPTVNSQFKRIMHKLRFGLFTKVPRLDIAEHSRRASDRRSGVGFALMDSVDYESPPDDMSLAAAELDPPTASRGRSLTTPSKIASRPLLENVFDDERGPAQIRSYIKNDPENFFGHDRIFENMDKVKSRRHKRYDNTPKNKIYSYLKRREFNYELIRDIILANRKIKNAEHFFNAPELINLMCLDRSGSIAIDFLTNQFPRAITRTLFSDRLGLAYIIRHFYHNPDVMRHLQIDLQQRTHINNNHGYRFGINKIVFGNRPGSEINSFEETVRNVFKELYDKNQEAAFDLLIALIENQSTQKAVEFMFTMEANLLPEWLHGHRPALIQKLHTLIVHVGEMKPNSIWANVAAQLNQRYGALELHVEIAVDPLPSLFAEKQTYHMPFFMRSKTPSPRLQFSRDSNTAVSVEL